MKRLIHEPDENDDENFSGECSSRSLVSRDADFLDFPLIGIFSRKDQSITLVVVKVKNPI
jgi:hypothetical protein